MSQEKVCHILKKHAAHRGVVNAGVVIEIECKCATKDELRSVRKTSRRRIPSSMTIPNSVIEQPNQISNEHEGANLPGRSQVDGSRIFPNRACAIYSWCEQSDAHEAVRIIGKVVFWITTVVDQCAISKPSPSFKVVT